MTDSTKLAEKPVGRQPLDLALIGNCRVAALVDATGRLVWWCFPRFDSDPVFSRLLAGDEEKGFVDVVLDDLSHAKAAYVRNTAIVETELEDRQTFVDLLGRRNAFGLLSEDIHPETGALWGNIPQTYSMAAIIDSAMRLSVKWEHAWRRV